MTIAGHDTGTRPQGASHAFEGPGRWGWRFAVALSLLAALAIAAYVLHEQGAQALSLSLVFGALFGLTLQRSRFCFLCSFRDWHDRGDPRGLLGIVVALAVGVVGYTVVFGAWLPDAGAGRLPPDAFIGPVSIALVVAGLAFGAGMAISGSCVSAHLYRLGEGSPTAPFALVGTAIGFGLGFQTWSTVYLDVVSGAPAPWIPGWLGYAGALIAALGGLAAIAALLVRNAGPAAPAPATDAWSSVFGHRWPSWIGGAVIGVIATAAYLRVGPLGVTAEIGSRARQVSTAWGLGPLRLEGLDTLRGCIAVMRDALLTNNGVFVGALVVASFAAALYARQFEPRWPTWKNVVAGLSGGVLLGWGAMTGLGCTIGALLSGIMAGAVSGWIFGIAVFAGLFASLRLARLLRKPSRIAERGLR